MLPDTGERYLRYASICRCSCRHERGRTTLNPARHPVQNVAATGSPGAARAGLQNLTVIGLLDGDSGRLNSEVGRGLQESGILAGRDLKISCGFAWPKHEANPVAMTDVLDSSKSEANKLVVSPVALRARPVCKRRNRGQRCPLPLPISAREDAPCSCEPQGQPPQLHASPVHRRP